MAERQLQNSPSSALTGTSGSTSTHRAVVEMVDGYEVQLEVRGTETIAEVRRAVLDQVDLYADDPNAYVVATRSGRPIEPGTTVDQLLSQGETLDFLLLKPAAFGDRREVRGCA